jgi:LysR family hydrogen peroxide-inducible transcriptional activator
VRQFAKPAPSRTVGAVWRKTTTRGAAINAVCDLIDGVMSVMAVSARR